MLKSDTLKSYLSLGLVCEFLQVTGDDGQHFEAILVSDEFQGLTPIRRHQKVYQILGDRMQQEIHALSMKTFTPAEWVAYTQKNAIRQSL